MVLTKMFSLIAAVYLDVDKKLPEVARRHHNGGVELDNVAFVQSDVMIRGQSLRNKAVN